MINRRARPVAIAACLAVTALLASAAVAASAKSYVLQLSDLGPGFKVEKTVVLTNAVTASDGSVTVAQLKKWGRVTGYEVDYGFEAASTRTKGPIAVNAKVNLYRKVAGAGAAWKASLKYAKAHLGTIGGKSLRSPRIGDESWAFSYEMTTSGLRLTAYLYTWRVGTRSAALMAAGLKGKISQRDAQALVVKQLARMRG
ncbi:MAG: hypothetical protein ACXVZ1_02075 [Gaiellaceae bacterium]